MTVQLEARLQTESWRKKMQKEQILLSVWEQLSNRVEVTAPVPNAAGMEKVPDAVMINVTDSYQKGNRRTTVPFMGKLNGKGQFGRQKVLGEEETPEMKYKTVNYGYERKGVDLEEESVDGDMASYYRIGAEGTRLLTDYYVELTDYNCHRALVEGCSYVLQDSEAWDGASITSAPCSDKIHPNVYANGKSAKATYSATPATYEGNVQTYLDSLTSAANGFDRAALNSMVLLASQTLIPLGWRAGSNTIKWVFLLSETQAEQLQNDTASGNWDTLMREADVRGDMNRAISGIIGVYKGALIIVNPRSPLWNTAGSAGLYTAYLKPWSNNKRYNENDVEVAPANKTGAGVGTCECAIALGRSAIGCAKIKPLTFNTETLDYEFSKGMAGKRAEGTERMDFDITTPTATSLVNQTSYLYFTATPAKVY